MGASSGQPATRSRLPFLRVTTQLDADLWIYLKVVADPEEHEEEHRQGQHESRDCPKRAIWPMKPKA